MRNLSCLFFLGIVALALSACGGATSGGASSTVTGQAGGQPVPTTDTVGIIQTVTVPTPSGTVTENSVEVAILNIPNTCAILQRHGEPANIRALALGVAAQGGSVQTGTYTIGTTSTVHVNASFVTTDAACTNQISENGTSGTVTFTSISASAIQGSFDVRMNTGDHLTGTFDAPVCNYTASTTNTPPTCGS
jgi:hypothetical protein